MYLKQIEMVGFKSFADRTKITFDTGVTAIVGPNGSGKSNVTESLRWALGEQSAKSLRGAKMPDIIFAGTQKRRAMNYAEVIVTFDNEDDYLPSEKTVIITRRLYRNGDSEFLINGKKVRLKDVHDLFMDTGLGRDSFSIISQGKIEAIFNSKPEERRAIFEEAAGVLKYKNRKKETESKLAATQENMDRLDDIIYELDGQLTPLRAQCDVALRFRELDATRSQLEISVLVAQIIAEKVNYESAQAQFSEVQQTLAQIDEDQAEFDREVLKLKQQRATVEAEQEKLQAEILTLTTAKSDFQSKIDIYHSQAKMSQKSAAEREERISSLSEKVSEISRDLQQLSEKLSENQTLKATLETEIAALQGKLANFSENPDDVIERLRAEFVDLVNQEAQLSNALTKNTSELENIQLNAASKSDENQVLSEKYMALKIELAETAERAKALKAKLDTLLSQYRTSEADLTALNGKVTQTQEQLFSAMGELNKFKASLTHLENVRANHSNFFQGVKAVLQATDKLSGIIGAVADLVTFDKRYATAMEIAIGNRGQFVVVSDELAAKSAINFLKNQRLGRATFLPLTTIKPRYFNKYAQISTMTGFIDTAQNLLSYDEKITPAISNLLGSVVIVDNADNATKIARAMNYSIQIVTLDGTQINAGGSFTGGTNKQKSTSFTNVEIDDLTQKVTLSENGVKIYENELQELQNQKTLLTESLINLRQQGEQARLDSQEYELKEKVLCEAKTDLESRLALSSATDEQTRINKLTTENAEKRVALAVIDDKKKQINTDIDQVKSSQTEVKVLSETLRQTLQKSQLKLSEITSEIKYDKAEIARLTSEKVTLASEIQALTSQNQAENPEVTDQTLEKLTENLSKVSEKLEAANIKQVSLRFEREDLTAQIEDLDIANADNIKQRQEFLSQKTRLELSIETSENRLRNRQNKLINDYQMSFEAAQDLAEELANLQESERQLQALETQIRKLGPVNLAAIEQFDEVNNRREFLNTQKEDLLNAKNLLESTINDMDDEVKIRFKSTFEAIRTSFQTTFTQMFGGGQADLRLTSDNLLDAGIEIAVQPPGKKLASLNLMSGGEKSLTALALLFAIIRVRTVPFVVLDEVEAALDEANVKRFGDYMTRFDESSQFIVVTHRKGTMKAAKAMYGVTMQEGGISKIVSVKLKDYVVAEAGKGAEKAVHDR
ncbi:chromosome partition protein Smc [Lactococcus hodotermopsidis]|uniref:Chromosome partition protein Smc n=1 Tax=Pseudolactococcus hodotermopsidis TaxID=2709157 RepID=A0A6A0B9B9_9LACT|nr:chromosome segregation protein SMC [Lactococcus hodotermopsidis]GFH42029.1 chromosome partition protein Smc [Lactococcus hodotermopsidis]